MKQLTFPLIIICLAGTVAVVVLELLFGNWFSTDPWKRADRLNIVRARRVEFDVSALRGYAPQSAMAQIELFNHTSRYAKEVYVLPKHLDEKVARPHLDKLGVKLTPLTPEQASYIRVKQEGLYKPERYRH